MTTNMIYTMAAAARVLAKEIGDKFKRVEAVRFFSKAVQVTYRTIHGRCSAFLSGANFKQDFVASRKESAKKLKVNQVNHTYYKVSNPEKNTAYICSVYPRYITCQCEDYQKQFANFGKACCKHGYAILDYLGFDSLHDYIKVNT